MTWIKICGITNVEDALAVTSLGADAVGFIFAPSKRRVEKETVRKIVECLPKNIEKIGVFVDERREKVEEIASFCGLTGLQFHGQESLEYCNSFKGYKVIKAIRVDEFKGFLEANLYLENKKIDKVLLDTYVKGIKGGTGKTFPWYLVNENIKCKDKIIVAGGITPRNILDLKRQVNPFGIDVSSGVEESFGKKDKEKLKLLFEEVKSWRD